MKKHTALKQNIKPPLYVNTRTPGRNADAGHLMPTGESFWDTGVHCSERPHHCRGMAA